ncbi:C6 zinc finger domain protein [Colletotrichum musicola]|uniref:C6 zinc finger domain protein n=1 Tax=Colletotrichum musicola TaxID=2175873 RepID=A0A8H6KRK1_9PEZI|nr:C6 zinc finger domain protein [Colletotrichum musicola]
MASNDSRRLALATVTLPSRNAPLQVIATGGGRRQCWECQRRRIVCDAVRPVCGKCKATGVVCPGYEDKKPLTWLAPGKVKTRTWKRKTPAKKGETTATKGSPQAMALAKAQREQKEKEAAIVFGRDLRSDMCDIVEATVYWNDQMYPDFSSKQLDTSPWIVPVRYIQYMPPAIQHGLVSMALDHRIMTTGLRKDDPAVSDLRERFHQHRCTAIKALNEDVNNERRRGADLTLSGVVVFLYADLMSSATCRNWRHHMSGLYALMDMRGGFLAVLRITPYLGPILLFMKIIEVLANTTSPANDQQYPLQSYKSIEEIGKLYASGYYPFLPCPEELFVNLVRINRLRNLVTTGATVSDAESPRDAAEDLLERIIEFSPEAWAEKKEEHKDRFLLMAKVYQSAATLFAISSLQGAGALPPSSGWRAVKKIHYGRLIPLLEESYRDKLLKHCITWPLIVAGFEAKTGTPAARSFVSRTLAEESKGLGVYLPMGAKLTLEKFWSSGKNAWDECFDEPNAFVM